MEEVNHKRFLYAFRINKMVIFEVEYGAIKENKSWHFSTSANKFVRNKRNWDIGGQCQEEVLKGTKAFKFWQKWDKFHLKNLTKEEYQELLEDIEELKKQYKYIYKGEDYRLNYIHFEELKELSMEK